MTGEKIPLDYRALLSLQHKGSFLEAGLCLSSSSLSELQNKQHLFLHEKENLFYQFIQYDMRKRNYLIGRYCAKQALLQLSKKDDVESINIEYGVFQQPIVSFNNYPNLQISISHNEMFGSAIAFPEKFPMAIDIETISEKNILTLQTQATQLEQELFAPYPLSKEEQLTLIWTIKEAMSKIIKCGLTVSFDIFSISSTTLYKTYYITYFKYFYEYQAFSFIFRNTACTIVCPKQTHLSLNVNEIDKFFMST